MKGQETPNAKKNIESSITFSPVDKKGQVAYPVQCRSWNDAKEKLSKTDTFSTTNTWKTEKL